MNITGIVTEYNPLHGGHMYHIDETKKETNCDGIICIMSGNFVQRGTPAILNKWDRTKIALESGVDLVIELPLIYSLSSAEFFAFGAVSLLNSLGIVDNLSFGSESGNINLLYEIAKTLNEEPHEFKEHLRLFLKEGDSYAKARSKALNKLFNTSEMVEALEKPNNILAVEYCKSLIKLNSSITPYAIKRVGSSYNSSTLEKSFSSATAIRNHLKDKNDIELLRDNLPQSSFDIISRHYFDNTLTFEDSIFNYIKYKALTSKNTLENLPDVSEGLHNKIYKALYNSTSYNQLMDKLKSKRYAHTRLNRILCQYFIGFDCYNTDELRKSPCPYGKILGFNNRGREILRKIKKNSTIPIYTKLPKSLDTMLNLDIQGTRAYSIINSSISYNSDFIISPIKLF